VDDPTSTGAAMLGDGLVVHKRDSMLVIMASADRGDLSAGGRVT